MERSSAVLGVRERLEESVPQKMIHSGKNAENPLSTVLLGRTPRFFTQKALDPHIPSKKTERLMILKTILLKYLSEKQTYNGRALGALTAWLARRWVSKDV